MTLWRLALCFAGALLACSDKSSDSAQTESPMTPYDAVTAWARNVDSLASTSAPREFNFPSRSTEGGAGRLYRLADSSVRIDIDDLRETGKNRTRFYARGAELRLAVSVDQKYDRPMSGIILRTDLDSTWFAADTAIHWRDSANVVYVQRDSILLAHGKEVFAEYLRSIRMAENKEADRRPR